MTTQSLIGPTGNTGPTGPQGLTGPTGTSLWQQNGTNIYYNAGNVGIGKTTPTQALDVSGSLITTSDSTINSVTVGRGNSSVSTNTAIGYQSLFSNTTGTNNTAIGYQSLYLNTTGSYNTASGRESLNSNTTGSYNTASGYYSLRLNTTGTYNTANGHSSLYTNTTGSYNTACGYETLNTYATGNYNTALGYQADVNGNLTNCTALGRGALCTVSNQIKLGNDSVTAVLCSGSITAASFTATSDYRIKHDVQTLNDTYKVDKLRPVSYYNTLTKNKDIGVIAHELHEVYPFMVTGEKDGEQNQSVNYMALIGILIKEIQQLKERVELLENK